MISVDEALARILGAITPLAAETVPLAQACWRTVARDVQAGLFNPAFDVSAMDGYAVRATDLEPGATLKMIGASQAGAGFAGTVGPGQCARIFTGAPVPEGADAVIMQEDASADGQAITFSQAVQQGRNIRFRGEDFSRDDVLVRSGTTLTPQSLALIAAGNAATVEVFSRPSIGLLATGDELVPPGSAVGADQIVASNSIGLAALLVPHARSVVDNGIIGDDRDTLGAALATALAAEPDVLITTGGASVGEHDLVQEMLRANGVEIDFWRIAMRPGKPLMFGRKGRTLVFGLPGNPVSALVTARILVLPAVLALAGATPPAPLFLPLAEALPANGPRRHFLRGRLVHDVERGTMVEPIRQTDSGHLTSLASAEFLVVQSEHCSGKARGAIVPVHAL